MPLLCPSPCPHPSPSPAPALSLPQPLPQPLLTLRKASCTAALLPMSISLAATTSPLYIAWYTWALQVQAVQRGRTHGPAG